ncbi:MAG: translational GTPase TypA [Ruminococcaceae bacterium]|nr:translational GTPase TypA [Oscillospiraceae bacterium]
MISQDKIRNIAIIAHVDHGKTTLVDAMLKQSGTFRENEQVAERVMDSNDLERERGITILAKNTSFFYKDIKINVVDTPGHADFGGEVERSLELVDGVLLVVDAFEGCMPQTRFVLKKALALNLRPIIVVNKVDRPNARPYEVVDEVLELFLDLDATDEQIDSPVIFTSARDGWASEAPENPKAADLQPLFELIVNHIAPPKGDMDEPFQMLVSNIDFDEYTGRIAIGKVERGVAKLGAPVTVCCGEGTFKNAKISTLYNFEGLKRIAIEEAGTGELIAISGLSDINIGETLCDPSMPEALPFVEIDQPVLSMQFSVNDSPFAGRDGTYVTSRHLRDRLFKELESNISLKVEETESADTFTVSGRGELHLSVLIENMRRQGYEFQVSKPAVITREMDGVLCEPVERLVIDVPDEFTGPVMEGISLRKGEMTNMTPTSQGYTRLEFLIPSRGLIGFRNQLLTETKGTAVMNSLFEEYQPYKGEIGGRQRGSLVAFETGTSVGYGLFNAQDRGSLFIGPGVEVYEGMVVGENSRAEDVVVNVCKKKHVTNTRASGSDDALKLTPPRNLSLEQCLEFIAEDELVEITPEHLRMRKRILKNDLRGKARNKN